MMINENQKTHGEESPEAIAQYLREIGDEEGARRMNPDIEPLPNFLSPSLLVLRSQDVERLVAFYTGLGMTFQEEKHGQGPTHYSTKIRDFVLEIYPSFLYSGRSTANLRIGFVVRDVAAMVAKAAKHGASEIMVHDENGTHARAQFRDPDRHVVELTVMQPSTVGDE